MWHVERATLMFRRGWDTKSRNARSANLVGQIANGGVVLDVGGGDSGVDHFIRSPTIGVDLCRPSHADRPFVVADVRALPFRTRSVPAAVCIDVLEHVAPPDRECALCELVRVSNRGLVIAFPDGEKAEAADVAFEGQLRKRKREVPSWLLEHRANTPLPTHRGVERVVKDRRGSTASVTFCEPLALNRIVRWTSTLSRYLYGAINLGLGLVPRTDRASPRRGYRAVLVFRFTP